MELKIEQVQQMKRENEANANDLLARLEELKLMSQQTEKCSFAVIKDFGVVSFGALNLRTLNIILVSSSLDKCIKMWDLEI